MNKTIFSGTAQVEIQGDQVLRLVARGDQYAKYQVIGFDDPVTITDRRKNGLVAISRAIETKHLNEFASQFNAPAEISIKSNASGIRINLRDTDDHAPVHKLWIAIGVQDRIPVYDYLFERLTPFGDTRFAFLALFARARAAKILSPVPLTKGT